MCYTTEKIKVGKVRLERTESQNNNHLWRIDEHTGSRVKVDESALAAYLESFFMNYRNAR
jgi:hypothetical protein